MAPRRLVSARHVELAEAELRRAIEAAWEAQYGVLMTTLRSYGIGEKALVAAAPKDAQGNRATPLTGQTVVPGLWSPQQWQASVDDNLSEVAEDVAQAAVGVAAGVLTLKAVWGLTHSADATAQAIVDRALSAGDAIGQRLNDAAMGAGPSGVVLGDISGVFGTALDILGDVVGRSATTAATAASNDVASYVVSVDAPEYLSATKSWVNAGDDKVRETHQDVDDVAINAYFDVGGEALIGPGDPQGSDSEVLNCRCHVEYDGLVPEGLDFPAMQGENA